MSDTETQSKDDKLDALLRNSQRLIGYAEAVQDLVNYIQASIEVMNYSDETNLELLKAARYMSKRSSDNINKTMKQ